MSVMLSHEMQVFGWTLHVSALLHASARLLLVAVPCFLIFLVVHTSWPTTKHASFSAVRLADAISTKLTSDMAVSEQVGDRIRSSLNGRK